MDPPNPPPSDQPGSRKRTRSTPTRTFLTRTTGHNTQGTSPTETDAPVSSPTAEGYEPRSSIDAALEGVTRSSPSASSSQGDMADTEQEAGPSQSSQQSPTEQLPTKKKRTRTLTTPHQSAVLHALLAQSRFPTTAMREEVGRAIGLSARKVQIWFQNQRQKARRPRGQSTAPLTRPPQYGPFSNIPPGTSEAGTSARAQAAFSSLGETVASAAGRASDLSHPSYLAERFGRSTSLTLSGPGIPGPSASREQYALPREAPGHSMIHHSPSDIPDAYSFDPLLLRSVSGLQVSPQATTERQVWHSADFSATPGSASGPHPMLPPIIADPRDPARAQPGAEGARYPPLAPISTLLNASAPPRASPRTVPPPPHIPPPFTLQPSPMWDDPAFSPYSRPAPSSRPSTSYAAAPPPSSVFAGSGTAAVLPPTPVSPRMRPQSPRPSSSYTYYDPRHLHREDDYRTPPTPRRSPR